MCVLQWIFCEISIFFYLIDKNAFKFQEIKVNRSVSKPGQLLDADETWDPTADRTGEGGLNEDVNVAIRECTKRGEKKSHTVQLENAKNKIATSNYILLKNIGS